MKNKRAGAYFGMHFDFHASDLAKEIGSKTTREALGKYLDEVKPDYLQVDTKGHPGLASYFSEYGDVAPGLTVDQLKMIREETKKRGISLIAHHSSIWDEAAGANHPEWAIIESDGKVSTGIMDTTSDYVDKKFIFMLKELCGKYGFDGVWVDGDCWCVYENYRPEFVQKFYEESGFESIDKENLSSPSHIAFRKYCKKEFERYVKYYINETKKDYPDFEICSNTAFTNYYPVKPFDEIDFLSADVYDLKYRVIARSFASHNKPWDIMSWGHPSGLPAKESAITGSVSCNNHLDVVKRIAAEAISLGGGFQNIGNMTAQGEMVFYEVENMKKLSGFMMERKPFNYGSKPLENAAVWLSEQNRDVAITTGSVCEFDELDKGFCDLVIDGGRPVDVIFDYHIDEDNIANRGAIIVPESKYISNETKQKLLSFVENGGSLVVTGVNSCKIFADQLDAQIKDFEGNALYVEQKSNPYYMAGFRNAVVFENFKGETVCNCYVDKMDHSANQVVISPVVDLGKGKIVYIGFDIMREYYNNHRYVLPYIMNDALCMADKKPNAYLKSGTNRVEIIPAKKDDMLLVNVINTSEFYYFSLKKTYGDIPAICDIEIAVRCDQEPKNIMLQPENKKAEYTYDGEYAYVKLSKLHIHTIIAVES